MGFVDNNTNTEKCEFLCAEVSDIQVWYFCLHPNIMEVDGKLFVVFQTLEGL